MEIFLNGKGKKLNDDIKNLEQCVDALPGNNEGVIVELNGKIIKYGERESILLKDGDKIELIQFMGGG
ncbi:MAG: sulfur carrier protein ThiS [Acidobacteriota bacterium]